LEVGGSIELMPSSSSSWRFTENKKQNNIIFLSTRPIPTVNSLTNALNNPGTTSLSHSSFIITISSANPLNACHRPAFFRNARRTASQCGRNACFGASSSFVVSGSSFSSSSSWLTASVDNLDLARSSSEVWTCPSLYDFVCPYACG
jgi:hypothetical protein